MSNSVIVKSDKKITKKAPKSEDGSSTKKLVIKNVYAPSKSVKVQKSSKIEAKTLLDIEKSCTFEPKSSKTAKTVKKVMDVKIQCEYCDKLLDENKITKHQKKCSGDDDTEHEIVYSDIESEGDISVESDDEDMVEERPRNILQNAIKLTQESKTVKSVEQTIEELIITGKTFFSFNGYTVYLDKQNIIELKPVNSNCYESIAYECELNEDFKSIGCTESGTIQYIDITYECEFNQDFKSTECTETGAIQYVDVQTYECESFQDFKSVECTESGIVQLIEYMCECEEEIEISYTRKVKDITIQCNIRPESNDSSVSCNIKPQTVEFACQTDKIEEFIEQVKQYADSSTTTRYTICMSCGEDKQRCLDEANSDTCICKTCGQFSINCNCEYPAFGLAQNEYCRECALIYTKCQCVSGHAAGKRKEENPYDYYDICNRCSDSIDVEKYTCKCIQNPKVQKQFVYASEYESEQEYDDESEEENITPQLKDIPIITRINTICSMCNGEIENCPTNDKCLPCLRCTKKVGECRCPRPILDIQGARCRVCKEMYFNCECQGGHYALEPSMSTHKYMMYCDHCSQDIDENMNCKCVINGQIVSQINIAIVQDQPVICDICKTQLDENDMCKCDIASCDDMYEEPVEIPQIQQEPEYVPVQDERSLSSIYTQTKDHIIIPALAGCGKTYQLVELHNNCSKKDKWLYLVFNKKNAEEAEERFKKDIMAQTFNKFCGDVVQKETKCKRMPQGKSKLFMILNTIWPSKVNRTTGGKSNLTIVKKFVERCKANMLTHESPETEIKRVCMQIAEIDAHVDYFFKIVQQALEMSQYAYDGPLPDECDNMRDMDDDLYWFATVDSVMPSKSIKTLLVDEVQDCNECQIKIIEKFVKNGTRVICVGDKNQSIYDFRGSSSQIFQKLEVILKNPIHYSLVTNYRCSPAIIKCVNKEMAKIRTDLCMIAGNTLQDGDIAQYIDREKVQWQQELIKGDEYIIARTNSEILSIIPLLLQKQIKFIVRGFELEKAINAINQDSDDSSDDESEEQKNAMSLRYLIRYYGSKAAALKEIRKYELSQDSTDKCTQLMTVHKSKGLENSRVIVIAWPYRPDSTEIELINDQNCYYVALTRAINQLYIIQ